MEGARYVDELLDEYLLFRGFVKTFTTFSSEKAAAGSGSTGGSGSGGGGGGGSGGSGGGSSAGSGSGQRGGIGGGGASGSTSNLFASISDKQSSSSGSSSSSGVGGSGSGHLPTGVEALTELLLGHVRALDLDQLQEVWSLIHSKYFVHLDSANARAMPHQQQGGGGGGSAAAAPFLAAAPHSSLGGGLAASPSPLATSLRLMEQSLKKALLVRAVQRGRQDKLAECMAALSAEMMAPAYPGGPPSIGYGGAGTAAWDGTTGATATGAGGGTDGSGVSSTGWEGWFALSYLPNPESHPAFAPYFSKRWFSTLAASLRNLLAAVFRALPLPTLLAFNVERERRRRTTVELRSMRAELERTRAERDTALAQLARLKSQGYRIFQRGVSQPPSTMSSGAPQVLPPPLPEARAASVHSETPAASSWSANAHSLSSADTAPSSSSATPSESLTRAAAAAGADVDAYAGAGAGVALAVSSPAALESDSTSGAASDPGFFRVCDTHALLGHSGPVLKVRFNHEGSSLLTMSNAAAGSNGEAEGEGGIDAANPATLCATSKFWHVEALVEQARRQQQAAEEAESGGNAHGNGVPTSARSPVERRRVAALTTDPASDDDDPDPPLSLSATLGFASPVSSNREAQRAERERRRLERGEAPSTLSTPIPARRALPSATTAAALTTPQHNPITSPKVRARTTSYTLPPPSLAPGAAPTVVSSYFTAATDDAEDDDAAAMRPYCTLEHSTPLASLCWSKSDTYLLTGSASDGKIGVYNLARADGARSPTRLLAELQSPDAMPASLAGGGSGSGSGSSGGGNSVPTSASALASAATPCPVVLDLVCSPGDRFLVAAWASRGHADWDGGSTSGLADDASGLHLRGVLELWDLASGKRDTVFHVGAAAGECTQINSLALNHNGNMLVSGGADGMVRVWDTRTSQAMVGWSAHALSQVACLRLAADETTVISAALDGECVEWSLHRMGKVIRRIAPPQGAQQRQLGAVRSVESRARAGSLAERSAAAELARPELALDGETRHMLLSTGFGWGAGSFPSASADPEVVASYPAHLFCLPPSGSLAGGSGGGGVNGSASVSPAQRLLGHAGPVLTVDWHPSANLLITGSGDHTARMVSGTTRTRG